MIMEERNGYTVLQAEEGFVITNGDTYGKKVYLSEIDNIEDWYETEEVVGSED